MAAEMQRRNGAGRFTPTEEVAERDALVLRMLAQGLTYQQVVDARLPGIANAGAVSKARRRALDAIRAPAVEEYRAETLAKLDALEEGAWQDVRDPGPKVSVTGAVVRDPATGEPLPDNGVRDQARNTVLKAVRTPDEFARPGGAEAVHEPAGVRRARQRERVAASPARRGARRGAGREGTRAAELRAQLAGAHAPGPPPLALVAGKDGKP